MPKRPTLPKLKNPMHSRGDHLELRFEEQGVDDPTTSTIIRGASQISRLTEQVEDVRKKTLGDRTLNKAAKKVEFAKYVDAQGDRIFGKIQAVQKAIDRRVAELQAKMNRPIRSEATSREAEEIRKYISKMEPQTERIKFIRQRIDAEDWDTCSACLGTKHYLAGLDKEHRDRLKKYYKSKRFEKEQLTVEAFEKVQTDMFARVKILTNYQNQVKGGSVVADIAAQQSRLDAMKS